MTKREIATAVATEMHKVNPNVNVSRMTDVLIQSMTAHELQKALEHYTK